VAGGTVVSEVEPIVVRPGGELVDVVTRMNADGHWPW